MNAFAERLKKYMSYKKVTPYRMNKDAGLTTGLLIKALASENGISTQSLEKILRVYPDLNANWLVTGRGRMLNSDALSENDQPLPADIEASLYHTIVWHILLQDSYDASLARMNYVLVRLDNVKDACAKLISQLEKLKAMMESNYAFQPMDHGMYEMTLRIVVGDDEKNPPLQLKDNLELNRRLRDYLGL